MAVEWATLGVLAAAVVGMFASFVSMNSGLNSRIDSLDAKMCSRFDAQDAKIDNLGARLDRRIDQQSARIDQQSARIDVLTATFEKHLGRHPG